MIRHVVLIKLSDDSPDNASDLLIQALENLPGKIEEICFYQAGKDLLHGPNSADVCLVADFEDLDALERYRVHPEHRRLIEKYISPYLEWIKAADYEY